jgi:amino-acid N-acetyltransferase
MDRLSIESVAIDAALLSLLRSAKLPTADVQPASPIEFFGTRADGELVGVVALERCGSHGLLRSLAVSEAQRGSGVGRALVAFIEQHAAGLGFEQLYLLTTDASGYFRALGYAVSPRTAAPEAIARTSQFASLCPDSAILMQKSLAVSGSVGRG